MGGFRRGCGDDEGRLRDRSWRCERDPGGPLPVPTPGPDEVLVEVEAVAVNPVDAYIRSGSYPTRVPMPFIIGRDLVGTVAEAGPAKRFRAG